MQREPIARALALDTPSNSRGGTRSRQRCSAKSSCAEILAILAAEQLAAYPAVQLWIVVSDPRQCVPQRANGVVEMPALVQARL